MGCNRKITVAPSLGMKMKKFIIVIALLLGHANIFAQSDNIDELPHSEVEQNRMISKARLILDEWGGDSNQLNLVSNLLTNVIRANPQNIDAHYENARYFLKSGFINFRNFKLGALENAESELNVVLQLKPNWGKAYVLLGQIKYLENDLNAAIEFFKKAERLGTDDNWLYIYWGNTLAEVNDFHGAEIKLRNAQVRTNLSTSEITGLNDALIKIYDRQRKFSEENKIYKEVLASAPHSAWNHGRYAEFLLFGLGQYDKAIAEAKEALSIMDYGAGHLILGTAQYAKWAQMKSVDPVAANEYFLQATENAPDLKWVFPRVGASVDASPALQNLVLALIKNGASIDMTDDKGDTAFTLAAGTGNIKAMVWLANHGANINYSHDPVPSALFYAIHIKDFRTINALIALKADLNLLSRFGTTSLMDAAIGGDEQIVKKLVASGADWGATMNSKTAEDLARDAGNQSIAAYLHSLNKVKK